MNILCFIDILGSGGAQRQLVELAILFKSKGHKVSFLTYHPSTFYKSTLERVGIDEYCVQESNYIKRLFKIRKFIRNGNYESVISFLEGPSFMAEIAGFPFRKWSLIVGERSANPKILKSWKAKFFRCFHLFADYVVANSHTNIEMVQKICPLLSKGKCEVIYNMLDFEKWNPVDSFEFGVSSRLRIVVAASHQYLKNLNGLIEAVHLLPKEEQVRLQVDWYGGERSDDSKRKGVQKIAEYNLSSIFKFHKDTISITEIIQQADCVGLFSFYEGLPNAVCEGMACGKPIIASNVSDVPVLLKDYNYLVNPEDSQDIANALSSLLNTHPQKLKEIGEKNRANALNLFDKESIYNQYIKLITSNG